MEEIQIPKWNDYNFLSNPTDGWIDIEKPPPLNEVVAFIMKNPAYNDALMCFEGKRISDTHVKLSSGNTFPIISNCFGKTFTHWHKISK